MTENKYILISLFSIIMVVFVFLGYIYYSPTKQLKEVVSANKPIADSQVITSQTQTLPFIINKTSTIKNYQPTETERLFYRTAVDFLMPKPVGPLIQGGMFEGMIIWNREIFNAFPPRGLDLGGVTVTDPGGMAQEFKRFDDPVSYSKQYYEKIILNLQELVKQCVKSSYYSHYRETIELMRQMQKEEEEFYGKYDVGGVSNLVAGSGCDVYYRGNMLGLSTVPLNEKISGYIHCLRYSYFCKLNAQYIMEFGDSIINKIIPREEPMLSGAKLAQIGIPAVPAVLNILEDRRPIMLVDETDVIPLRFYRYQDAAVEILERMFTANPFPIWLADDEYFSEYMEKQTPEARQKIIGDIKEWVQESMKNPAPVKEPPEQVPNEQK